MITSVPWEIVLAGQPANVLSLLRGVSSFIFALAGAALFLFSVGAAFGWDKGPVFSIAVGSAAIAAIGLSLIFAGYWVVRDSDGAPLAAICLKWILGFGSTFIVIGVIALFIQSPYTPTWYFIMTGCLC